MTLLIHSVLSHFNIPEHEHAAHISVDCRKGKSGGALNKAAIRTYRAIYYSMTREERNNESIAS